jgi:hypothetical protein
MRPVGQKNYRLSDSFRSLSFFSIILFGRKSSGQPVKIEKIVMITKSKFFEDVFVAIIYHKALLSESFP